MLNWDAPTECPSVPGALLTATYRQPGLVLTDRRFTVPLDHDDPAGETIELYAREAVASDKAGQNLPWLVYLQGGPGFGANRFVGKGAWFGRALKEYRVLLLDQRGTGHSSPANRQTLPLRGGPAEQADYLARFRGDSIVRDCEAIRPQVTGGAPWTVLGQSFGGFCTTSYLSLAPEGLAAAVITGGLPSLDAHADDVYRAAYPRIERKVTAHYARYPQDVERARRIADHLLTHDVTLPNGHRLTVEAFQSLGILLGGGEGSHRLHLLEPSSAPRGAHRLHGLRLLRRRAAGLAGHLRRPGLARPAPRARPPDVRRLPGRPPAPRAALVPHRGAHPARGPPGPRRPAPPRERTEAFTRQNRPRNSPH